MFDWTICLALDKRAKIRTIDHICKERGWHVDLFTCGEGKIYPQNLYNHIDCDYGEYISQKINYSICLKKITQIAKSKGFNQFFFFEDDAEVNIRYKDTFVWQLGTIWANFLQLNFKWDMLYLAGEFFDTEKYLIKDLGDSYILKSNEIRALTATIINKTAFDKILEFDINPLEGADRLLNFQGLETFCIAPNIFTTYENYSFNENKKCDHSKVQYL